MFGLFKKDQDKKLQQAYQAKLEKAVFYERNGDLRTSSQLRVEAEGLYEQLQAAEAQNTPSG